MDRDSRLDKIFEIERQLPDYALAVLEQLCEVFHTMNLNNISQNEHEIPAFDPGVFKYLIFFEMMEFIFEIICF